jgi:hypothetical protein
MNFEMTPSSDVHAISLSRWCRVPTAQCVAGAGMGERANLLNEARIILRAGRTETVLQTSTVRPPAAAVPSRSPYGRCATDQRLLEAILQWLFNPGGHDNRFTLRSWREFD